MNTDSQRHKPVSLYKPNESIYSDVSCSIFFITISQLMCLCAISVNDVVQRFDVALNFKLFTSEMIFSCIIPLHMSVMARYRHHTSGPVLVHGHDARSSVAITIRPPADKLYQYI